eukprot:CAMPEP_0118638550 /NCGR_PEP_ID=MMETSP0785-20121206/3749_1 /TAXON_ID=91992 /ORGANISM="Bolidomonas pacifica, Strain CCMP 1866" /LENGTH=93 /DNA_ID=CAMNT_0006529817 /DNA_START=89 /DNA_END=370 /DNA_ORIENTATION=-
MTSKEDVLHSLKVWTTLNPTLVTTAQIAPLDFDELKGLTTSSLDLVCDMFTIKRPAAARLVAKIKGLISKYESSFSTPFHPRLPLPLNHIKSA